MIVVKLLLLISVFTLVFTAEQILKKSVELPKHDLPFPRPSEAVSPKSIEKREADFKFQRKGPGLPKPLILPISAYPKSVNPKSITAAVVKRASDFVGDASYPVTEPPRDSITPEGVEKESWVPHILGLGTKK